MPQTPLNYNAKQIGSPGLNALSLDKETGQLLMISGGGDLQKYNVSNVQLIKNTPGRLCKIVIINLGTTGGAFTFNDYNFVTGATIATEIITIPYNTTLYQVGSVITLDWPCATGIALTAVPTGGSPQLAISYL